MWSSKAQSLAGREATRQVKDGMVEGAHEAAQAMRECTHTLMKAVMFCGAAGLLSACLIVLGVAWVIWCRPSSSPAYPRYQYDKLVL